MGGGEATNPPCIFWSQWQSKICEDAAPVLAKQWCCFLRAARETEGQVPLKKKKVKYSIVHLEIWNQETEVQGKQGGKSCNSRGQLLQVEF